MGAPIAVSTCRLHPLLHVSKQVLDGLVRLLSSWQNLAGREDKSVATGVTELHSKDIVCASHIVDIVHTRACGWVNGRADGAIGILRAVERG